VASACADWALLAVLAAASACGEASPPRTADTIRDVLDPADTAGPPVPYREVVRRGKYRALLVDPRYRTPNAMYRLGTQLRGDFATQEVVIAHVFDDGAAARRMPQLLGPRFLTPALEAHYDAHLIATYEKDSTISFGKPDVVAQSYTLSLHGVGVGSTVGHVPSLGCDTLIQRRRGETPEPCRPVVY
jgi:hypothetical protein